MLPQVFAKFTQPLQWAWPVLLVALPLGIALQNIAILLVLLLAVWQRSWDWKAMPAFAKQHLLAFIALMICLILSTVFNPANPANNKTLEHFFGYLPLMVLPVLLIKQPPQLFRYLVVGGIVLMAGVSLTQYFLGWSLHYPRGGLHYRPHGLYGHPLTLAYVALLLWPMALCWWWSQLRSVAGWLVVMSVGWLLFATDSRACQAAAVVGLVAYFLPRLSWRQRGVCAAVGAILFVAVFATDNPISERYRTTFSTENPQRFSDYPDDRLAFWHAHALMIQERPLLGHGIRLNSAYRQPYYEQLGLGDFIRRYSAHNLYIQVAAEGGIIALVLFLLWMVVLWRIASRIADRDKRSMFRITLLVVALASITQNSLMDATFRNVFTAMLGWMMFEAARDPNLAASSCE